MLFPVIYQLLVPDIEESSPFDEKIPSPPPPDSAQLGWKNDPPKTASDEWTVLYLIVCHPAVDYRAAAKLYISLKGGNRSKIICKARPALGWVVYPSAKDWLIYKLGKSFSFFFFSRV